MEAEDATKAQDRFDIYLARITHQVYLLRDLLTRANTKKGVGLPEMKVENFLVNYDGSKVRRKKKVSRGPEAATPPGHFTKMKWMAYLGIKLDESGNQIKSQPAEAPAADERRDARH